MTRGKHRPSACVNCGAECSYKALRCIECRPLARRPPLELQPWMRYGRCYVEGIHPDVFFPRQGGDTATPKRICATCPAREQCLQYALENGEKFGIWGGTSEKERRSLRRDRKGVAA